ncbi:hypothetical protein CRU96_10850 [Malaciobacter halophilus]|nr:NACHT domain-containing protein [Malaciobacter halophilus]RYA22859.1 hypothetical protein CRU96_10850 [Malaciobacter halophilus]
MSVLLSTQQKKQILRDYKETDMHKELKILFDNIFVDKAHIHITHGANEFGRDLIISEIGALKHNNTSIVVKMDKLSGSATDKAVQEIRMQVDQCFNYDFPVKDSKELLKTDYVYIIIFGEISANANKNLDITLNQYKGRYEIFGISKMLELFDEYYSGIFYGASGFESLNKKYDELEEQLFKKNKLLKNCYIEPNLKSYNKSKQELIALLGSSDNKKSAETFANSVFGKKETLQSLMERLNSHRLNILVDGNAGSGKTVFAIKLVQAMIKHTINSLNLDKKRHHENIKAPVIIKATDLKNGNIKNLNEIVNSFYMESSISIEPSLLIIDGLDEVSTIDRNNILEKIKVFASDKLCSLMFTSRKNTTVKELLSNFNSYELLEFESSQVINFIRKMLKGDDELIKSLLKGIEQLRNQIPMYPMSLALLIEIAQSHKEVPASISELYSRYMEMVINTNSYDTNITTMFEPYIKYEFLEILSYELFYKFGTSTVKRENFDKFVEEYKNTHAHIYSVEDFVHELCRISILVISDTKVEFLHKSFLDYFVARYYISQADSMSQEEHQSIYKLYYSALWEDVTFFYFGIKRKINKIQIDRIIENSPILRRDTLEKNDQLQLIDSLSKFQLGKLMQYAWHTSDKDKQYAISISANESLELKEKMIQFHRDSLDMELPSIVSDASMLHFIELTHTSIFIEKPIEKILDETIEYLKKCDKEQFSTDNIAQANFYFCSLYVIVNATKISLSIVGDYIKTLLRNETKIPVNLALPVFGLFSLFKNKKKILNDDTIDKADIKNLDVVHKKLRKKHSELSNEVFTFRNKADMARIQALKKIK